MRIVCSASLSYATEAFGRLGDVAVIEESSIGPADVAEADALIVRSTTRIDAKLLHGSKVGFVGTATIGSDHIDKSYLESRGICWCSAPGCNANSVCEYVFSAILCLSARHGWRLDGLTLGIVGVGNIGKRLAAKAALLGMRVLCNDPPRARAEGPEQFVSLERLLDESDVVTMHVPLTREGPDATFHLADDSFFRRLKARCFINSSRGAITDTASLLEKIESGWTGQTVIDTWEGEPAYSADLQNSCSIGTPHIAGYSFEGKAFGTMMVYEKLCAFLGAEPEWSVEDEFPPPPVPLVVLDAAGKSDEAAMHEVARQVYDIEKDDAALREEPGNPEHFRLLRKNYPVRREFRFTRASVLNGRPALIAKLEALGFTVV